MKRNDMALLCAAAMMMGTAVPAGMAPLEVFAEETEIPTTGSCGENLTWNFDEATGTLTISGEGEMMDCSLPSYSPQSPWTALRESIKEVVIEEGVTSIGGYAFYLCNALTSITIPDSVTSIEWAAFFECKSLTSVAIPDSVMRVEYAAFGSCENLTSVIIPESVTRIESSAFSNTPWLEAQKAENPLVVVNGILIDGSTCEGDVVIPDGVTSIGGNAFYDCDTLTSVTIPNSVTNIGDGAFEYCDALTSVTILDGVTYIGYNAFSGCKALTSVVIPDGVTSIKRSAFSHCEALTTVVIPDSVTSIDDYAFSDCTALTSVTIPESVTSIGGTSFWNTPWLETKLAETPLLIVNGILVRCSRDYKGDITIPDGVTSIASDSFPYCGVTSVTIPDGVTSIGEGAFGDCWDLTSITIPDSVTSIEKWAFSYTPWLRAKIEEDPLVVVNNILITGETCEGDVVIPDGVTSILDYAFYHSTLTSLTIPSSVTSVGNYVFTGREGLNCITFLNPDCEIADGLLIEYEEGGMLMEPVYNGTIRGYEGSTAQTYAEKYGYTFESLGAAPETTDAPSQTLAAGDLTGDSVIDIMDVIKVNKYLLGSVSLSDAEKAAADVDSSGEVDSTDSLNILKYVVELIDTLPITLAN